MNGIGAGLVRRDLPQIRDVGLQIGVIERIQRHAPEPVAGRFARGHQAFGQRIVGGEQPGKSAAQGPDDRSGEGRHVDHHPRLKPGCHVMQRIAQYQPAFGICVDDLDRGAAMQTEDIARAIRGGIQSIDCQGHRGDDVDAGLPAGQGGDRPGHRGTAGHVALHVPHALSWLQRDAAGIEGDALADQRHRLFRRRLSAGPMQQQQPWRNDGSGPHGQEPAAALTGQVVGLQHLDPHAQRFDNRPHLIDEALRRDEIGRRVGQIAGQGDPRHRGRHGRKGGFGGRRTRHDYRQVGQ